MTSTRKIKIGVCGVGSIGFRHARLLSTKHNIELAVCDPVKEHLEAAEKLDNIIGLTNSCQDLLALGLDGLIIATPDRLHVDQAVAASEKGAAVLIEKPIAENAAEAGILLEHEKNGAKILVGYPLRHNPLFHKAKNILDDGTIGVPVGFNIKLGAYNTLVAAKNRFNDTDVNKLYVDYSHEWDYLQWFLGPVEQGIAAGGQFGERERMQMPNVVNALLKLKSGINGTAGLDYIQSPGKRQFEIIGDIGSMLIDAVKNIINVQVYDKDQEQQISIPVTFDEMMNIQIDHFVEVIKGNAEASVKVADGINALRVADALIHSTRSGNWQKV